MSYNHRSASPTRSSSKPGFRTNCLSSLAQAGVDDSAVLVEVVVIRVVLTSVVLGVEVVEADLVVELDISSDAKSDVKLKIELATESGVELIVKSDVELVATVLGVVLKVTGVEPVTGVTSDEHFFTKDNSSKATVIPDAGQSVSVRHLTRILNM